MQLRIEREPSTKFSTPGKLYIDNVFFVFILEDVMRADPNPNTPQNEAKVYGETCIPAGRYRVRVTYSPKFKKKLPEILNVPGYTGIRLHGGVTAKHSLGCPLTGQARVSLDEIAGGIAASEALKAKIEAAEARGEEVWITILNPPEGN